VPGLRFGFAWVVALTLTALGCGTPDSGTGSTSSGSVPCSVALDCPSGYTCYAGICTPKSGGNLGKTDIKVADSSGPDAGGSTDEADAGATTKADTSKPANPGTVEVCKSAAECDDGNGCTKDDCIAGLCVHPNQGGTGCGCASTKQCDDGNSCTVDKCLNEVCSYSVWKDPKGIDKSCCKADDDCATGKCVANRCLAPCQSDGDCATDKPCTAAKCVNGQCGLLPIQGCCATNADCGSCATCDGGACVAKPDKGCCEQDGQCDDGNACTTDSCKNYACSYVKAEAACCESAADCNDGNPCTTKACTGGKCSFSPKADCCKADADCDDGKACSVDSCIQNKCQYDSAPCNPKQTCGDGQCLAPSETCSNCPSDCGSCSGGGGNNKCGNGVCDIGETLSCPSDCNGGGGGGGSCVGKCGGMGSGLCWCDAGCSSAGDCCSDYATACGGGGGAKCGNGKCETGETKTNCPGDCGGSTTCGNGKCTAAEITSCNIDCGKTISDLQINPCVVSSCSSAWLQCKSNATCKGMINCILDCGQDDLCAASCVEAVTNNTQFASLDACKGTKCASGGGGGCGAGAETCKGKCGGAGSGGCMCDDLCEAFGDCCPDFQACGCF
jgi:hypothetical protein